MTTGVQIITLPILFYFRLVLYKCNMSSSAERLVSFDEFRITFLESLGDGDEAFHGMLYPDVYPPDREAHERLKRGLPLSDEDQASLGEYCNFVRDTRAKGAHLPRLRLLPEVPNDDVPYMIEDLRAVQEAGETVRVSSFGLQTARLRQTEVLSAYADGLELPYPTAGFWSVRTRQFGHTALRVVGVMNYTPDDVLPGVNVYSPVPAPQRAYADFWQTVFSDPTQSFPLERWEDLYN